MSTTQKDKSGAKPRQRGRKTDQRQKSEIDATPKHDRKIEDQINALMAEAPDTEAAEPSPVIDEVAPSEVPLVDDSAAAPVRLAETSDQPRSVSMQSIANAYQSYARRSFQDSRSFIGKLMGTRSFDKAIELQTEFATQAYVNFVAESQKICELYHELASEAWRPWQRLATQARQGRP
jgi:hypothetical protein